MNVKGISNFNITADFALFDLEIQLVTEFAILVVRELHLPHIWNFSNNYFEAFAPTLHRAWVIRIHFYSFYLVLCSAVPSVCNNKTLTVEILFLFRIHLSSRIYIHRYAPQVTVIFRSIVFTKQSRGAQFLVGTPASTSADRMWYVGNIIACASRIYQFCLVFCDSCYFSRAKMRAFVNVTACMSKS